MAEVQRDYAKEKQQVYDTMIAIIDARPPREKKERIGVGEIREASGLDARQAANAIKWLGKKGLAHTDSGKDGWFLDKLKKQQYDKFCWLHGVVKETHGRGKKKRFVCPICERNEKKE